MTQGRADRKGPSGQKVEPNSKGVNPGAVSYFGNMLGNHVNDRDITLRKTPWNTQGYNPSPYKTSTDGNAPGAGMNLRPKGSQGKY
jgi:hypothetical protein